MKTGEARVRLACALIGAGVPPGAVIEHVDALEPGLNVSEIQPFIDEEARAKAEADEEAEYHILLPGFDVLPPVTSGAAPA